MADVERLKLKREYFPIIVNKADSRIEVSLPPRHPLLNDFEVDRSISVLDESIEETIKDIRDIESATPTLVKITLDRLRKNTRNGKYYGEIEKSPAYVSALRKINSFPFVPSGCLYIASDGLNDKAYYPDHIVQAFNVNVIIQRNPGFPEELIEEYGMTFERTSGDQIIYISPKGWKANKEGGGISDIFYKNLLIALDNSVLRKKYLA